MGTASHTKDRRVIFNERLSSFYTLYLPPNQFTTLPLRISPVLLSGKIVKVKRKRFTSRHAVRSVVNRLVLAHALPIRQLEQSNLIGKLRSLFTDLGRGRKANELLDVGAPASHPSIRQYLASIREERAEARVTPRQATPLFYQKKKDKKTQKIVHPRQNIQIRHVELRWKTRLQYPKCLLLEVSGLSCVMTRMVDHFIFGLRNDLTMIPFPAACTRGKQKKTSKPFLYTFRRPQMIDL